MSGPDDSAQAFCADLVRARDFNSYAASLFVPAEPRRGWLALAAFNVEVSQVRDHVSQPLPGEIRLQWWRDTLTNAGQSGQADALGNPVAAELLRAVKQYDLPVDMLVRLIDAHVFDVYDDPMPDMAALEAHCRDTSATMYALRATILGGASPDITRLAEHAGIAEGLTEIMLALPCHAARRQLYLPGDLMSFKGAVAEEIFTRHVSAPLKDVLAHLRGEAHTQLDVAMAMLRDAPREVRPVFLPIAMARKNLQRLKHAAPFDPPLPLRLSVLWTMWRAASSKPFKA